MAESIRAMHAEKHLSDQELHAGRMHKAATLALIAAGTLALLLIFYWTAEPTVQPASNSPAPIRTSPMDARH